MKFKQIPSEYFITILDRLTRFEPAYMRYSRVFDDIINKFSLDTKAKNLSLEEKIKFAVNIINASVGENNDFHINEILMSIEEKYFNFNQESYQYLSARINFKGLIDNISQKNNLPKNITWLKFINKNQTDIQELRKDFSLLYPIEKILLCEGQTEFELIEVLFSLFDIDINKLGILIIPAGGKNQVARKFYQLVEYVKIPFFILLDKDADSIKKLIEPKLRKNDSIYLINSGEFEDLIPKNILKNAINNAHDSEYQCFFDDFDNDKTMVENLEFIYKKYGFGEFKKAKFAQILKEYILKNCAKYDFENSEIINIINKITVCEHF